MNIKDIREENKHLLLNANELKLKVWGEIRDADESIIERLEDTSYDIEDPDDQELIYSADLELELDMEDLVNHAYDLGRFLAYMDIKEYLSVKCESDDLYYKLIDWTDAQDYMDEDWFVKESITHICPDEMVFPCYLVPLKRLRDEKKTDKETL